MNPVPTDAQWLVLYMIEEGDVVSDGAEGWRGRGAVTFFNCTGTVRRLHQLGLIELDPVHNIIITADGVDVLKRRSVYEVLERRKRRRRTQ